MNYLTFTPMETIRNKVEESGLIQLDLADFKPKLELVAVDLSVALWQGLVLKEKEFRTWVKEHNWQNYQGKAVYVHCSADAIVPTWAFMLVASVLVDSTEYFIIGSKDELEKQLIAQKIAKLPLEKYADERIIIKGCSDIGSPAFAMSELMKRLQPIVQSIMYGEPCSTVPIFKRKKG